MIFSEDVEMPLCTLQSFHALPCTDSHTSGLSCLEASSVLTSASCQTFWRPLPAHRRTHLPLCFLWLQVAPQTCTPARQQKGRYVTRQRAQASRRSEEVGAACRKEGAVTTEGLSGSALSVLPAEREFFWPNLIASIGSKSFDSRRAGSQGLFL